MPHRVLLIDPHRLVRDGIRAILEHTSEFNVVAEADNGADALRHARESCPDLAVLEIAVPTFDGRDLARELVHLEAGPRVVILSSCGDEESVMAALRSGARGYVLKQASAGELLEALRRVARGGSYFSPQVHDHLVARIRRGGLADKRAAPGSRSLTPRELEVLRMVTAGQGSREIAVTLGLSVTTVRSYRKSMMRKLGVNHIAALMQVAVREGLTGWTHTGAGSYT